LTRTAAPEYDGGVSDSSDAKKKRPYVPPRVVKVQPRLAGDNLATGCKDAGSGGPTENPCEAGGDPCQFADTS
jgi:hypothetical protein